MGKIRMRRTGLQDRAFNHLTKIINATDYVFDEPSSEEEEYKTFPSIWDVANSMVDSKLV
jgi:hypothetical protein